ncbi:FkbM family methyltransferase [Nocardioides caricicola]|uniref:FkbM family methyltransferase n=1 Tax=Nocardioides caricicola TaxID=634770 RepID=A0ABW0N382_9ACTN
MDDAGYLYFRNLFGEYAADFRRDPLRKRVHDLFLELCLRLEPTIGLEIGAHEASFSQWLKAASPSTRCLAFEANPHVAEKYRDRVLATGVEYRHLAVGPTNGPAQLVIPTSVRHKERRLTNRMASLSLHTESDSAETVEVESVRLDDFLTLDADDRLVAWVDVEGATEVVLGSGPEVLRRTSLLYIEVEREAKWHDQWLDVDVARHLAGLGFTPIARDAQRPHQYNVVFAAPDLATDPEVARLVADVYRVKRNAKRGTKGR